MSDEVVEIGHKAGMSAQTSLQVIQALLENQMKATAGGREWENRTFTWVSCEGNCPWCQSSIERTAPRLGMHWASGSVRCVSEDCTYKSSTMSHIGRGMFPVAQMPPGALPIYYNESAPSYISDDSVLDIANSYDDSKDVVTSISEAEVVTRESASVGADSIRDAEDERIMRSLMEIGEEP